jgi:signal transduction histidine kinase
MADRNKIVQVLENLLSNAIKFSPDGGKIVVGGKTEGNFYRITVADEGIGMTPEQIEKIFIKFYRADNSSAARSGMGLGMSIVKHIVDRHGGSIRVESEMGRGTAVSFTVPLAD